MPVEVFGRSQNSKAFGHLKCARAERVCAITAFCRANLAGYKIPRTIVFRDLPKTSTGKVQKFVLRDKEWAGKEKKIN